MAVNGQLIASKKMTGNKLDTYFGAIGVYYQPDGVAVTVSTAGVRVSDGRNNHTFSWASTAKITQER